MKRLIFTLLASVCMLSLAACGNWLSGERLDSGISEKEEKNWVDSFK